MTPDGRPIHRLVLGSEPGIVLELLDHGATVSRLLVTGGDGVRRNVVLGHAQPGDRAGSTDYLGATVGRYANRIAGGRFELDGQAVEVAVNDRGNHLHGGSDGFDQRTWEVVRQSAEGAVLRLVSPDGDQGFPGALVAEVEFRVKAAEVRVGFRARSDRTTVVNMTQHAYFNLEGEGSGSVDEHLLSVEADLFTPVDATGIPRAGHESVVGTPFDLRSPTRVGAAVRSTHEQVVLARGLDHNFVVRGVGWRTCATLECPRAQTRLEMLTDQSGLQVYSGNFLDGTVTGPAGALYRQGDGIALEPQAYPDSPNRPDFPSTVLRPGGLYQASLAWRFSAMP